MSLPFLLNGCFENRNNTDKLCQQYPALKCEDVNMHDGQCRLPRTNLIWHRLNVIKDPSDVNKIEEYSLTQAYKTCLEVATQIQPLNQPELKQRRFNSLINSGKNMVRLEKELLEYHTPASLYFLWSQTGSKKARREFLQLEGKPGLDTAEMQYALATFYIDKDRNKTIKLLHRALQLSDPKKLNVSILESLASLNQLLRHKEASYMWAIVGKHFGVPIADERGIKIIYGFKDEKFEQLDDLADKMISAIEKKQFKPSLIPEKLLPKENETSTSERTN